MICVTKGKEVLEEGQEFYENSKEAVYDKVDKIKKGVESAIHKV